MPRRRLVPERPHHRAPAPPGHGKRTASSRSRSISARATRTPIRPRCRTSIMRCAGRSRMRRTLKTRAGPCRPLRPVERRASRHARRHAAATIRAMRRSRCRPVRARRMRASRCVVMSWPVINPFSRYRHAKRALAGANPPEWPKSIIPRQDAYWRSEANMAEGNPMLALERGEKVANPAGGLVPGPGRRAARLQGRRRRASPAMSRSASSRATARPAARSRWNISTPSAMQGIRRTSPRPATCSSAWPPSCIATSKWTDVA